MGYVGATAGPYCWVHLESPRLSHLTRVRFNVRLRDDWPSHWSGRDLRCLKMIYTSPLPFLFFSFLNPSPQNDHVNVNLSKII